MRKVDSKQVGLDHMLGERGRGMGIQMSGGKFTICWSES